MYFGSRIDQVVAWTWRWIEGNIFKLFKFAHGQVEEQERTEMRNDWNETWIQDLLFGLLHAHCDCTVCCVWTEGIWCVESGSSVLVYQNRTSAICFVSCLTTALLLVQGGSARGDGLQSCGGRLAASCWPRGGTWADSECAFSSQTHRGINKANVNLSPVVPQVYVIFSISWPPWFHWDTMEPQRVQLLPLAHLWLHSYILGPVHRDYNLVSMWISRLLNQSAAKGIDAFVCLSDW